MRSHLITSALTIALGLATPIALTIGFSEIAVAQTVDQRKVEADRLLQQGLQQYEVSQFEVALQSWQQALQIYREIKNRYGEGNALGNIGIAYASMSKYTQAIEYLEEWLSISRKIKELTGEGASLVNLGLVYSYLGKYTEAIEFYEQSLVIFNEIKDRRGEGKSLGNLGLAYYSLGKYAKSIEYYGQSLSISREIKDRDGESVILGSLGNAYDSMGSRTKAIEYHEQSLSIAREIKNRNGEGAALNNLGLIYFFLGDSGKAIEYYDQSLAIMRQIKNRHGEGATLGNLGDVYNYLKNYAKAVEYNKQSLAIAREVKDRNGEGRSLGSLGKLYYSVGKYGEAIKYYENSLVIARQIKDADSEYISLDNLGYSLAKQEPELAIVFYKQAVSIAESIRKDNRPLSRDLQSSYTKTVAGTYRNLADLLLSQGRVLEAQQVLELLKIQELRDFTKDTRYGGTADRNLLNPLEKPIATASDDKIKLGDRLTQCEKSKCSDRPQLTAQVTQANETFDQQVKRLKDALKAGESKDPAQLQNEEFTRNAQNIILNNPRKTLLLYPLVLDDKLWLVWGTQAGKKGVIFDSKELTVSRKDLSAQVLKLQNLLKTPNTSPKEIQLVSQQLYQWLIQPIRQQLTDNGIQNIVFSLDRATRYIPMAALHDGKQYLIENFTVSTILTAQTDTTDKLSPTLTDNPVLGLGVTRAIGGFSALPAVQSELDSISKIFPGMTRFDQNFTETTIRENISDHRILHIATHGTFNTNDPNNSFLLLGDGKQLSIPTIESMKNLAGTHLVVLSACETGKGGIDKEGLEVAGMGHYFMLGGAKSVMASLWLVNDPATALLMRDFYTQLATGKLTKAEALRQTQISFLNGTRTTQSFTDLARAGVRLYIPGQLPVNSLAHPYYWAPFILIGNNL